MAPDAELRPPEPTAPSAPWREGASPRSCAKPRTGPAAHTPTRARPYRQPPPLASPDVDRLAAPRVPGRWGSSPARSEGEGEGRGVSDGGQPQGTALIVRLAITRGQCLAVHCLTKRHPHGHRRRHRHRAPAPGPPRPPRPAAPRHRCDRARRPEPPSALGAQEFGPRTTAPRPSEEENGGRTGIKRGSNGDRAGSARGARGPRGPGTDQRASEGGRRGHGGGGGFLRVSKSPVFSPVFSPELLYCVIHYRRCCTTWRLPPGARLKVTRKPRRGGEATRSGGGPRGKSHAEGDGGDLESPASEVLG